MIQFDAVVAGSGICGSVIARHLAAQLNKKVLLVEKRSHLAGNMYDYYNEAGILVHQYGPHIFHTNNQAVYNYINQFGEWNPFHLKCMVHMKERFTPSPFNFQTIDDYYSPADAQALKDALLQAYPGQDKVTIVELIENSNTLIKSYAQFLFNSDYSLYTAKQWGVAPSEIDVSVLKRVPVLLSYNDGYFDDLYQCMPVGGYTNIFKQILDHPNITIQTQTDLLDDLDINGVTASYRNQKVLIVYTGPIDAFFKYDCGALPYRSLRFEWKTENYSSYQHAPVVAYPEAAAYTRITEYNKLPMQNSVSTTIAIEYPLQYRPGENTEPYYPVLTHEGQKSYNEYKVKAQKISNLFLCGRLADFKYYNMDQAMEHAFEVSEQITDYFRAEEKKHE